MIRVLSLGAGVQSTTLALMAAHGDVGPMPDAAIFADTGGEPKAVYDHLAWLSSGVLPFPVQVVQKGDLWEATTTLHTSKAGNLHQKISIPVYTLSATGKKGMADRYCTRNYKIRPVNRAIKTLLGKKRVYKTDGVLAEVWIGISVDEAIRKKPSLDSWIEHRWPLLEKGMTRKDCLAWLEAHGYARPPKSACTYCPFHDNETWRNLSPEEFADVIQKERQLQAVFRQKGSKVVPYFHPSRQPIDEVDLREPSEPTFDHECEGMCGV